MAKLMRAWRWCKRRSSAALLLLVGVIIVFRLGWGWWVEKQLAAKQAGMHRQGEAADWREISYPAVKDEENAWPIWVKGINSLSTTVDPPRSTNVDYGDPPYPTVWFPVAAASEKANGQAIALA